MNIIWHGAYFYFNGTESPSGFKFTEYTPFEDLKSILEMLLQYSDNRRIVKLEYRPPRLTTKEKFSSTTLS